MSIVLRGNTGITLSGNIDAGNSVSANNFIGDGNLYLQPDPNNAGAYLNVYLSSGPDIHIAGNSETVILGSDELANVAVNINGNVSVQASTGAPFTWLFDSTGNLTLPQQGIIGEMLTNLTISGAGNSGADASYTKFNATTYYGPGGAPPSGWPWFIEFTSGIWYLTNNGNRYYESNNLINWFIGPAAGTAPAPTGASSGGTSLTVNNNNWIFGSNGTLSAPGNIGTTGNITTGNISITGGSLIWANSSIIQTNPADISINGDGQVSIRSLDGTYQWTFDSNGVLTMSGPTQLAVYANATVRDNSISSPAPGMMIYVTGTGMQVRGATSWNTIAGSST
jgi:hypothetical protein